jgi:hypothetical protein
VRLIQYRVNNGPLETYTRPFTISQEGSTFVLAQATDNAGNVETPLPAAHIRVDTLAPAINITAPKARDYLHSDTLTAAFSVTDSGSGVSGAAIATLDGSVWTGNSVALLTLPLGPHTLAVSAVDVAGNPSQASVTFHVVATVDSMMASVNAFAAQMENSAYNNLTAKLTDASEALRRDNVKAARNKLEEVLNYCTRESGRAMTAGAASSLSADAAYVLGTL